MLPFAFSNNILTTQSAENIPYPSITDDDIIISYHQGRIRLINSSPLLTKKKIYDSEDANLISLGCLDNKRILIHFHNKPISETEQSNWHDLRVLAMNLSMDVATVVAHASSLAYWHGHHQFCGLCGNRTQLGKEHSRVCSNQQCNHTQFPRVDPAVIMSVVNEFDEILLGRQANWDQNRFSVVAGFLSHGETLEQCVAREVLEETGIKVDSVEYIASQPWPFPGSIMLGFKATAKKQPITTDDDELEQAMWISREQLQKKRENKQIFISPRLSISRYLIDLWIAAEN